MGENLEKLTSKKLEKISRSKKLENYWDKWGPIYGAFIGSLPGIAVLGVLLHAHPNYSEILNSPLGFSGLDDILGVYMTASGITCFGAGFGALCTYIMSSKSF